MGTSNKHKEAMLEWGENHKQKYLEKYLSSPKYCKECNGVIPYEKRNINVFCSSSCSASYNNKKKAKAKPKCVVCGVECKSKKSTYCGAKCQSKNKNQVSLSMWEDAGIYPGKTLIKRYLSEQKSGCWNCGIIDWMNKPIVLELEHIDGNAYNNSKTNLSLLCPNCHSQTSTYKGKNMGNGRVGRRERAKKDYHRSLDK
jgi:hypothetical protein